MTPGLFLHMPGTNPPERQQDGSVLSYHSPNHHHPNNYHFPALTALHLFPQTRRNLSLQFRNIMDESQVAYAKAVKRCREQHDFFLLDLPRAVRRRIYSHLFNDRSFVSCSFNKDRTLTTRDEWPATARSQIIGTSRRMYEEAVQSLYWHTNWEFPTASSLSYFTWHDVNHRKLASVARITLTNLDCLVDWVRVAPLFSSLRTLVIDCGLRLERRASLPANQYRTFIERVKGERVYARNIVWHTDGTIPPRCCLLVVVELKVTFPNGRITREVCL